MAHPPTTEAYPAERAASLAGVPLSTVYYWASHDIWEPSVSQERTRYWSLTDLVALRAIYWLRSKEKHQTLGTPIPRTKMREVRRTMAEVRLEGLDLRTSRLFVDLSGKVYLERAEGLARPGGQLAQRDVVLDALRPFELDRGLLGPDLAVPRPHLRIIPGKLAGEPHVEHTRIQTSEIDGFIERGYTPDQVHELYPILDLAAIADARELEVQLRRNLRKAA